MTTAGSSAVPPPDAVPSGAKEVLRSLLAGRSGTVLLAGPDGAGQLEAARWLAALANCERAGEEPCGRCGPCSRLVLDEHGAGRSDDYRELRPAEQTRDGRAARRAIIGIDLLVPRARGDPDPLGPWLHAPPRARRRFGVIVRAEALSEDAANAFLKTLEEPPPGATIVLIAPGPDALLPTVASRCLVLRFAPPSPQPPPVETSDAVAALFAALPGDLHGAWEAALRLQELWTPGDRTVPDTMRAHARSRAPRTYLAVDRAVTAAEDALAAYAHRDLTLKRLVLRLRHDLGGT